MTAPGGNTGALIVALPAATDPANTIGDEPDAHITMNWFGPLENIAPELVQAITSVVGTVAMISVPFDADVSGTATLGDDGAKVMLLESAELVGLRELLMTAAPVAAAMSAVDQFPNWCPHVTLSYETGELGPTFGTDGQTASGATAGSAGLPDLVENTVENTPMGDDHVPGQNSDVLGGNPIHHGGPPESPDSGDGGCAPSLWSGQVPDTSPPGGDVGVGAPETSPGSADAGWMFTPSDPVLQPEQTGLGGLPAVHSGGSGAVPGGASGKNIGLQENGPSQSKSKSIDQEVAGQAWSEGTSGDVPAGVSSQAQVASVTVNGQPIKTVRIDALGLWLGDQKITYYLTGSKTFDEQFSGGQISDAEDEDLFGPNVTLVKDYDDDESGGLMAAGAHVFDEGLHPRDANGRFISKFGVIKFMTGGKWGYGTVQGIYAEGGQTKVTATPSDLSGKPNGLKDVELSPKQIYTAPTKKAHLNIDHSSSKKVGSQSGSNEGGLYEITVPGKATKDAPGAATETKKYYVKKPKTKKHGQNEELANDLYALAGVLAPAVDTGTDGNTYSEIIPGNHDMSARLAAKDKEWMGKVQKDFAVDAWLGNRDVFGLTNDNILTTSDGTNTPVRIDNGGALLFRAMGAPKTDFGSEVTELDVFRTGKKSKIFGPDVMSKESELDGAERVLAISPGEIDDLVTERGLPKSLADTLKARRAYIANYYGLPLPESIKPNTPEVSTSAPLVDAADLSGSHGKDRKWQKLKLGEAGFLAEAGDVIYTPSTDSQIIVGSGPEGLLTGIQTQSQLLSLMQTNGADTPVMLKKWQGQAEVIRPDHGEVLNGGELSAFTYERGDKLTDEFGNTFHVLGTNSNSGAILLRKQKGEGEDKSLPFLYDGKNKGGTFTMSRWDPPTVVPEPETVEQKIELDVQESVIEPVEVNPPEPAVPTGLAVEASKVVKADLVQPLPDGSGGTSTPDAPAAPESPSGVGMLLGDGNMAEPNDELVSKVDGKTYTYVKKKGPYAIVTSTAFGDDQNKLLTKKASTMNKKGATAKEVAEIAAPTSANGKVPGVGMHAVAKDGHEGTITMVSPDGKFVFITDANGKKKRKSVGTVTISGAEPVTEDVPSVDTVDPNDEFKSLSEWNLVVGDQISVNGETWSTVASTSGPNYLFQNPGFGGVSLPKTAHMKVMHKPGVAEPASEPLEDWEQALLAEPTGPASLNDVLDSPDLQNMLDTPDTSVTPSTTDELPLVDLPGGYSPVQGELVLKAGDTFYSSKSEGVWHEISESGELYDQTWYDGDLPDGTDQQMVFGNFGEPFPEATTTTPATKEFLLKHQFDQLSPGDQFEMSGHKVMVMGHPTSDPPPFKVIAVMLDDDPNKIVALNADSIHPTTTVEVNTTGYPDYANGVDTKVNDVYDNAWKTSDQLEAEGDLTPVSDGQYSNSPWVQVQIAQQGVDTSSNNWIMFDNETATFYSIEEKNAQVWNADTKSWDPVSGGAKDFPLVESLPVVNKPALDGLYGYQPTEGDTAFTVNTPNHPGGFAFVKDANDIWWEVQTDGSLESTNDPEFGSNGDVGPNFGSAWKVEQVYPAPTPAPVTPSGDSGAPAPVQVDGPTPSFTVPDGYDPAGKHLTFIPGSTDGGQVYNEDGGGFLWEETEPNVWQMVHYDEYNKFTGLGNLKYDSSEFSEYGTPESWKSPDPSLDTVVDTANTEAPGNVPPFQVPDGYDTSGKTLANMSNGAIWEKQDGGYWVKLNPDGTLGETEISSYVINNDALNIWVSDAPTATADVPAANTPSTLTFPLPTGYDPAGKQLASIPNSSTGAPEIYENQDGGWVALYTNPDGSFDGYSQYPLSGAELDNYGAQYWDSPTLNAPAPVDTPAVVDFPPFPMPDPSIYNPTGKNLAYIGSPIGSGEVWEQTGPDDWYPVSNLNGDLGKYGMTTDELLSYTPQLWNSPTPESLAPPTESYKGYVPVPGDKVIGVKTPTSETVFWVKKAGNTGWFSIQEDGSTYEGAGGTGVSDSSIADLAGIDGWSKEDLYGFDKPAGGGVFVGYTTPDNSTVVKTSTVGGGDNYYVTAPGWGGYFKIENGAVDPEGDAYDADTIEYSISQGFGEFVQGGAPDGSNVPSTPTGIEPGAKGPKQIKGADANLANGEQLNEYTKNNIDKLGQLEEGQTLWYSSSFNGMFVKTNTGEYFQVNSFGLSGISTQASFIESEGITEVKFTPAGPPTVGGVHKPPFTVPDGFDPTGKTLMSVTLGDTHGIMAKQPDGNYKIVGNYSGSLSDHSLTEADVLAGGWDTIVKWDGTNGTSVDAKTGAAVTAPVPTASTPPAHFILPDGFDPTGKKLMWAHDTGNSQGALLYNDSFLNESDNWISTFDNTPYNQATVQGLYDKVEIWDGTTPEVAVSSSPPTQFDIPPGYDPTGKTLMYATDANSNGMYGALFEKQGDGDTWLPISSDGETYGYAMTQELATSSWDSSEIWDGSAAPAVPSAPAEPDVPVYPGSVKPDGAAVASWGGSLTKDGHIPSSGMYVSGKGPMTGVITGVSKDKTKATVLTKDGKKTTRLIAALSVDTGKNYQVYAAPAFKSLMPVPDNMPIAVPAPKEALDTVFKTGKWMPIMHDNTKAVKSGSMFVQKATTPSGKTVARIHFVLTAQQRAKLLSDLAKGPDAPPAAAQFGDWEAGSVPSLSGLGVGQHISMRLSSSNSKWKVDANGSKPTHIVTKIDPGSDDQHKTVTLKPLEGGGAEITSSFKDGFTVPIFTWDPQKPKAPPPPVNPGYGGTGVIKLSGVSTAQGWKATDSNDWTIAGLTGSQTADMGGEIAVGGGVVGKLKVEPGQPVSSANKPWNHWYNYGSQPGLRKVNADGSVIEVLSPSAGTNSSYGYTVITVPEGDNAADVMQKAFEDLGMPYSPMTQDGAKAAVRGHLKQMLSLSLSDNYKGAQDSPAGDAAMFAKAGQAMGIPDLGWQDVEVGTDDSGTTLYFWSARAREAMAKKTNMGSIVRAIGQPDPEKIESTLVYGTADTAKKWVAGMPTSSSGGNGAGTDASNLAGNGSFSSAIPKSSGTLPEKNQQWGGATVAHTNPMNLIARIMDYRPAAPGADAYGKGQGNGANSLNIVLTQSKVQDFYPGGGLPGETIGFYAVDTENQRAKLISHFHKKGRSVIGGRKIEDIILTKSVLGTKKQSDLPPVWLPPNLTPLLSLPEAYPVDAPVADVPPVVSAA